MATIITRGLVAALTLTAGLALGQDADTPLLTGPEVTDNRPALVEDGFGEMATGKDRLGAMRAIPAQDLRKILAGMNAEEAQATIRLSEEQSQRVRELVRQYEAERREWMQEHRDELRVLQQAAGVQQRLPQAQNDRPRRGNLEGGEADMREPIGNQNAQRTARPRIRPAQTDAPQGEQEPKTPEQQAALLKLREFMQQGPSTGDLQRRIYAELSADQQQHIDAEVLRMTEERADAREMEKIQQRRGDRAKDGDQRPGADSPSGAQRSRAIEWDKVIAEDGSVNLEALPQRVRDRIENLSETDQKRAVEMLRQRAETGNRRKRGD